MLPSDPMPNIPGSDNDPDSIISEIQALMPALRNEQREYASRVIGSFLSNPYPEGIQILRSLRKAVRHNVHETIVYVDEAHHGNINRTSVQRPTSEQFTRTAEGTDNSANHLKLRRGTLFSLPLSASSPSEPLAPPAGAQKLLYLLSRTARISSIGDLDEDFPDVCRKFGVRFARRWYWWHAFRSLLLGVVRLVLKIRQRWIGPS